MDSAITQMSDSGIVVMQLETALQNNFEMVIVNGPVVLKSNGITAEEKLRAIFQLTTYFTLRLTRSIMQKECHCQKQY